MATSPLDGAEQVNGSTQVFLYSWLAVANGDQGAPVELPNLVDLTVVIDGTFGAAGSCTFEGSLDGSTYYALTDPQGNAITKTTAAMEAVTETPRYVRPSVTAGDGSTAINVRLLARRGAR
jgi:hypothetical protein